MEVNRQAPAVASDEIFIEASSETVWALQTDVNSWPGWRSGGLDVVSTVGEVEPGRRLGWTGRALGTRAVHTWTFEAREGGVLVLTEESFEGWLVRPLKGTMRKTLEGSLRTWLSDLKSEAESGTNRA